jgi:hypothetical protein
MSEQEGISDPHVATGNEKIVKTTINITIHKAIRNDSGDKKLVYIRNGYRYKHETT